MPITTHEHERHEALDCLMSWDDWETVLTEFYDGVVEASAVTTRLLDEVA